MRIFRGEVELGAMANISPNFHKIPNVKMNILQGEDARRSRHGLSVKVFKNKDIQNSIMVFINRATGDLRYQYSRQSGLTKKEFDRCVVFIQNNIGNLLQLWADETSSVDELSWVVDI